MLIFQTTPPYISYDSSDKLRIILKKQPSIHQFFIKTDSALGCYPFVFYFSTLTQ